MPPPVTRRGLGASVVDDLRGAETEATGQFLLVVVMAVVVIGASSTHPVASVLLTIAGLAVDVALWQLEGLAASRLLCGTRHAIGATLLTALVYVSGPESAAWLAGMRAFWTIQLAVEGRVGRSVLATLYGGAVLLTSAFAGASLARIVEIMAAQGIIWVGVDAFVRFAHRKADRARNAIIALTEANVTLRAEVTERLRAETALYEVNEDLEERVRDRTVALEQARDALQGEVRTRRAAEERALAASRAKSTFLANTSHELRTPLNAIVGYTELVIEEATEAGDDQYREDLDRVIASAHHLLGIIDDLLDLSRIEAGQLDIRSETVDLDALVAEVARATEPLARVNDNTLTVEARALGTATTDPRRLRQILFNLLENAARFTREGQITLTVRRGRDERGCVTVWSVADDGPGIPVEHQGQLFQPFVQVDDSPTRRHDGSGLGLAICRQLCRRMGGEIRVDSTPGQGSCFSFWLPDGSCGGLGERLDEAEVASV